MAWTRGRFIIAAVAAVALVCGAYANHFQNDFQFDDAHTIQNNEAIRSLANIPRFFVDATLTSSLPTHQAYRPGVVTLHAIDVALGGTGEPRAVAFHRSIFLSFLVLCVACFFVFRHLFDLARPSPSNAWWALCAATFFGVLTANAETINYISARSDSASTLMVLLAFVVRLGWPKGKAVGVDLLFLAVGFFIKEPAVMLVALIGLYTWLFEANATLDVKRIVRAVLPSAVVAVLLIAWSRYMTPATWFSGAPDTLHYIATQPFVVLHYVGNFILPLNLVIDTDWRVVESFSDDRVYAGVLFLAALVAIAWRCAQFPAWRPVAFGLLWFLLTLLPTSLVPLAEVLNDHRPFFGSVGLCLAVVWAWALVMWPEGASPLRRGVAVGVPVALLLAHTWGTHRRNEVWGDSVALWTEAAQKAPNQGRNHMNAGTALMARARWGEAEAALNRAQGLTPNYAYVYINLAIVQGVLDRHEEAERNFTRAVELDPRTPEVYSYFAEWLRGRGRIEEAVDRVRGGLAVSPRHTKLVSLEQQLRPLAAQAERTRAARAEAERDPTPARYLDLSLAYYLNQQYPLAIEAAQTALRLEPRSALAFNNICAASNQLRRWSDATAACQQALALDASLAIAQNNLAVALKQGKP
ncbi:MAG: tetratricopeptide repeat protein [Archangium sp.]|nr:tetratricopeptide repeat protein [Archangium sp.]